MESDGWSGGQFSLARVGVACALGLAWWLAPGDAVVAGALAARPLQLLAGGLALALAAGAGTRWLALAQAALVLTWPGVSPLFLPGLLALACAPAAPFGSVAAVGRVDPAGDWRAPGALRVIRGLWLAAGLALGVAVLAAWPGLAGGAFGPLLRGGDEARLALAFALLWGSLAPLISRWTGGPAWLALAVAPAVALHACEAPGHALGWLAWSLLAFDPGSLPPRAPDAVRVFYDGGCGICHGGVRILLAEDLQRAMRFGPLEGETLAAELGPEAIAALPDSMIVLRPGDPPLDRGAGALALMEALGGAWRGLAILARLVPLPLLDLAYAGIAASRKQLAAAPPQSCPIMTPTQRQRILP